MTDNFEKIEMLSVEESDDSEKKLVESLSVIKEVREQLAKAYIENKDSIKTIETLSAENESLKKSTEDFTTKIECLSKELDAYRARDEKAKKEFMAKRLETLSSNFKQLGQEKTVEYLSKLDEGVITEFENITSLALKHKNDESLSTVIIPTQSIPPKKKMPASTSKKVESLSSNDFLKGICNVLVSQQREDGTDSKRVKFM